MRRAAQLGQNPRRLQLNATRCAVKVLSTAAVDAAAEAEIFEHFQELTAGRIAILISHRFSTVRRADLIVVVEHGRILEQALMAEGGRYAQLFELQAEGYRG